MKLLLTLFVLMFIQIGFAQGVVSNSCNFAAEICDGDQIPLSTGSSPAPVIPPYGGVSNPSINPNPGNAGCVAAGEVNPIWLVINIESSGLLEFQVSVPGGGGLFDWIMWPYDSTSCQSIAADSLPPVACNMNTVSNGGTGMASVANIPAGGIQANFEAPINVTTGDQFLLFISNYSYLAGNLYFDSFGSAGMCQSTVGLNDQIESSSIQLVTHDESLGIKGLTENYDLTIVDTQGRIKLKEANLLPEAKINTNTLQPAMYFVYLETNNGVKIFTHLIH